METIYALSSAAGRAGVAVIRLSGPASRAAVIALTGKAPPASHRVALRRFGNGDGGVTIDRGLLLWFEGPSSFTGEDVAEFHLHGGRAVVAAMLARLASIDGLRAAEPGEYTRRAFENGKLDLTSVEGLADLINADTEAQRRQALRQMEGALGLLYEDWRGRLIRLLAYAEAEIDFPDEDLPDSLLKKLRPEITSLASQIQMHLDDGGRGERLRDGVEVVILGPPNVGKSSLMNALAGRDVAIVSAEAGTTRDIVEVRLDLGGVPVTLADTAGLREADGAIEQEGVRRALARAEKADLRIVVSAPLEGGGISGDYSLAQAGDLRVWNKMDLMPTQETQVISLSAARGAGVDAFLAALTERVSFVYEASEHPMITRARHREGLSDCQSFLTRVAEGLETDALPELIAEDLRLAARSLGRITGRVDVEDLLDVVFRDFCIGK